MPEEVPLHDAANVQLAVVPEKSLLQFSVQRKVLRVFVQPYDFQGEKKGKGRNRSEKAQNENSKIKFIKAAVPTTVSKAKAKLGNKRQQNKIIKNLTSDKREKNIPGTLFFSITGIR